VLRHALRCRSRISFKSHSRHARQPRRDCARHDRRPASGTHQRNTPHPSLSGISSRDTAPAAFRPRELTMRRHLTHILLPAVTGALMIAVWYGIRHSLSEDYKFLLPVPHESWQALTDNFHVLARPIVNTSKGAL